MESITKRDKGKSTLPLFHTAVTKYA